MSHADKKKKINSRCMVSRCLIHIYIYICQALLHADVDQTNHISKENLINHRKLIIVCTYFKGHRYNKISKSHLRRVT